MRIKWMRKHGRDMRGMEDKMKKRSIFLCIALLLLLPFSGQAKEPFRLLMSEDLQGLEGIVTHYFETQTKEACEISYESIADIQNILEDGATAYDALWISNSVPLQMVEGGAKITQTKFTAITPVIFALREEKYEALGFTPSLYMSDIVTAVRNGDITFVMPNVTQTTSGQSAYFGVLSALSGRPKVLTQEHLDNPQLQEDLVTLFSGMERSAGTDSYALELMKNGEYDAVVSSEANLIRLNQTLEEEGKTPLHLLYPIDGVTVNDTPLGYIDHGDAQKKEIFTDFQAFVLSVEGQSMLAQCGMRTDLGGLIASENYDVFREDWGIITSQYINTIVYPSKEFIVRAQSIYQESFRRPAYTIFCLDFSGSMAGTGEKQLQAAMDYILDAETAGQEFIQFSARDKIAIVPFSNWWKTPLLATGSETDCAQLLRKLKEQRPSGGTQMYSALVKALELADEVDTSQYSISIVVMTDGQSSANDKSEVLSAYVSGRANVPIYAIMFGEASDEQLIPLAKNSKGEVFDGREDLLRAFRKVRGYN